MIIIVIITKKALNRNVPMNEGWNPKMRRRHPYPSSPLEVHGKSRLMSLLNAGSRLSTLSTHAVVSPLGYTGVDSVG